MAAARFPDDMKARAGIHGYNHPTWYYIDNPITPKGDPTTGPQPEPPNAMMSLAGRFGVLKRDNPAADKAVAICWVLHLVGDIHQPPHSVQLYRREHPKGNRGGQSDVRTLQQEEDH